MPCVSFDELPPDARVWIFGAERPLVDTERARVLDEVDAFIGQWAAHDVPLTTARDVRYDQFIFVAVDERAAAGASGCSIDALVRRMKGLQAELGVELVNHAPVLYRDGADIARVSPTVPYERCSPRVTTTCSPARSGGSKSISGSRKR